jgi:hypothetical protein
VKAIYVVMRGNIKVSQARHTIRLERVAKRVCVFFKLRQLVCSRPETDQYATRIIAIVMKLRASFGIRQFALQNKPMTEHPIAALLVLLAMNTLARPIAPTCTATLFLKNASAPESPASFIDFPSLQLLLGELETSCRQGIEQCDVISIPHNSNISGGNGFNPNTLIGCS